MVNQIPKHDRYAEEVARIREVVGLHRMPDFVTGFDVELGEFDGDPAMWILFRTREDGDNSHSHRVERARVLGNMRKAVQSNLLEVFDDRFPYFRFVTEEYSGTATG